MMFYTAVNYRPYLPPPPPNSSFLFLAVGYFNVMLPSSLPTTTSPSSIGLGAHEVLQKTFWNRARSVRAQSKEHLASKMLPSRTLIMAKERGKRARRFAAEDDGYLARPAPPPPSSLPASAKPPSLALLGLSQLGPLDPLYNPESYPAIKLFHMRATTRKARGGMLLFTYTFRGKLTLNLGWDQSAFEDGLVEAFMGEVERGVGEFLVGDQETLKAKL